MLSWIREKFGPVIIGTIIGAIALVFAISGVFTRSRTTGIHENAVAGMVNGEPISLSEFNRELNRRMEFFKNMGGSGLTEAQLKAFHVKEGVFSELVNRKLMVEAADKQGLEGSDQEVMDKVRAIPAFQKSGQFDPVSYRQVLQANQYTPAGFEQMIREEISLQNWGRFFHDRAKVSDAEVKKEFLIDNDKRSVKYVLLTHDTAAKGLAITPDEISKFLAQPAKLALVKSGFDARKDRQYKGKAFDDVKDTLAREAIAAERTTEITRINDELAKKIEPLLTVDKASDAKINSMLKLYGVEVKTAGPFSRTASFIPGVGEAPELMKDAFAPKSPIDPETGGHAKVYTSAAWRLVAVISGSEKPEPSKFETDSDQVRSQIIQRKERALYDAFLAKIEKKAKIERNESVVGDADPNAGAGAPSMPDVGG